MGKRGGDSDLTKNIEEAMNSEEREFDEILTELDSQIEKLTSEEDYDVEFDSDRDGNVIIPMSQNPDDGKGRDGTWYEDSINNVSVFIPDDLDQNTMPVQIEDVKNFINDLPTILKDSMRTFIFTDGLREGNEDKLANYEDKTKTIRFYGAKWYKYAAESEEGFMAGGVGFVLRHELGHALDKMLSLKPNEIHDMGDFRQKESLSNSKVWEMAHKLDGERYVSEYSYMSKAGGVLFDEDVAEAVGDYLANDDVQRAYFEMDNPHKYDVIDKLLRK